MEVRPLRAGEENLWVGLNCLAEKLDEKVRDLVRYRHENPDLHPCTYLVAFDDGRIVGKLRTNTDDETLYDLAQLSVDPRYDFGVVGRSLIAYAKQQFSDRPLEAGSWEKPEDDAWHMLLLNEGFSAYIEKCYFRRDIDNYRFLYRDPFTYRSLAGVGEEEFLRQFVRIYPGHRNRNFADDPSAEFFEFKVGAGRTFDPRRWQIALLDGAPAGIVIPKVFDDLPEEGTIHTFGVFPEFRGRGFGKILHAKGLKDLADAGAVRYVGSTDRNNLPMVAVFRANDCRECGVRRQYRLHVAREKP